MMTTESMRCSSNTSDARPYLSNLEEHFPILKGLSYSYESGLQLPRFASVSLQMGSEGAREAASQRSSSQAAESPIDVVFYVGGSVWALAWCPHPPVPARSQQKVQYLAVGTHMAAQPMVRIGEPLTGKAVIQIWAIHHEANLAMVSHEEGEGQRDGKAKDSVQGMEEERGSSSKDRVATSDSSSDPGKGTMGGLGGGLGRKLAADSGKGKKRQRAQTETGLQGSTAQTRVDSSTTPKAKLAMAIAHEGGFIRDAKWRPVHGQLDPWSVPAGNSGKAPEVASASCNAARLGFLAAALGDGSVLVYNVPHPNALDKAVNRVDIALEDEGEEGCFHPTAYSCRNGEAGAMADEPGYVPPSLLKLPPIFSWKSAPPRRSLAMVVEWSPEHPWDRLLAGFHDGTVALWKVNFDGRAHEDVSPLMRFTAESLPIRALAWAPPGSGSVGGNLIVTAGHRGALRFWDLRDPFRPLWETVASRGWVLSIDWISIPMCLLLTMDDGSVRVLSLDDILSDHPVTGSMGSITKGMHTLLCRHLAVWDLAISRHTGQVAYCSADGTVHHFQLTHRWLASKYHTRNREPHHLLGGFFSQGSNGPLSFLHPPSTAGTRTGQDAELGYLPQAAGKGKMARKDTGMHAAEKSGRSIEMSREEGEFTEAMECGSTWEERDRRLEVNGGVSQGAIHIQGHQGGVEGSDRQRRERSGFEGHMKGTATTATKRMGTVEDTGYRDVALTRGVLVPKIVAVHRVKWNPNLGFERCVAYGGAAGLVRCQIAKPLHATKA